MKMHTIYSKLLFVGTGLLFAFNISAQDTLNQLDKDYYRNGYWILNMDNTPLKSKNETFYSEGYYDHGYRTGIWQTFIDGKLRSRELYENMRIDKYIKYDEEGNVIEMGILDKDGFLIEGNRAEYDDRHYLKSRMNLGKKGKILNGEYYDAHYECWFTFKDSLGKYYTFPSKDCDSLKLKKEKPPKTCDPENLPIEKKKEIVPMDTKKEEKTPPDNIKIPKNSKPITEDGEYKDGKLWNGKKYIYDKNGLLEKIEIYKEGKYVGDAEID